MCDTYVCLGDSSFDGSVIFGKNSDRLSSEPQLITYAPHMKHEKGSILKCTYIEIPQVSETASVLLSEPWWMWGAEMGANEYDVVIGNEAVATSEPLKDSGLLGMDLVRLGLERGNSAKNALDVIIELLERFGQGGQHNQKGLNYHNSMIIADPNEAYVLETAGEWWIVENVIDSRSISNDLSIQGKGDLRRNGIIEHAINQGYCNDDNDFNFATTFSTPQKMPSYMECSMGQLEAGKGTITPELMMNFLREHDGNICRHKRADFTAGSQVSHLREGKKSIHWFTGNALTCLSTFKPYLIPNKVQQTLEAIPYAEINSEWNWKKHFEYINPYIKNPQKENPDRQAYQDKINTIEKEFIEKINRIIDQENIISNEEFNSKIYTLNNDAWNRSIETIK